MDKEKVDANNHYCPTHGDSGMLKLVETTKQQISESLLKKQEF